MRPVSDTLREQGYAFLPAFRRGEGTAAALRAIATVAVLPGLAEVQVLRPRLVGDSPPNIYSGNFGHGEFPLHTDLAHWFLPPRYLALRCIQGAARVATRIVDGHRIVNTVGDLRLRRALVRPRRPVGGQRHLLRLHEGRLGDGSLLRWDSLFVVPASDDSDCTCAAVRTCLLSMSPMDMVLCDSGDTLILDNWRMLHGRSAIDPSSLGRCVERVYMRAIL